jgi:uncharacterized membrane protein YiaA
MTVDKNPKLTKVVTVVMLAAVIGLWLEIAISHNSPGKRVYGVAAFLTIFGLWRVYVLFFKHRP